MAHTQKPDFVFRQNGRVHLNRHGCQFSRLLAAEVCTSAVVMLDTPCSDVVWRVLVTDDLCWLPIPFASFPIHFSCASPCAITFQLDSTSSCPRVMSSPSDWLSLRMMVVSSQRLPWEAFKFFVCGAPIHERYATLPTSQPTNRTYKGFILAPAIESRIRARVQCRHIQVPTLIPRVGSKNVLCLTLQVRTVVAGFGRSVLTVGDRRFTGMISSSLFRIQSDIGT